MLKTTIEKVINEDLSAIWTVLDNEERRRIVDNFEIHNFKKNQIIYTQGEEAEHLWCLLKGKVKMYKDGIGGRQQILRLFRPVQYFGYRAGFANEQHMSSACAFEPSTLGSIPMSLVKDLVSHNIKLAWFFIEELSHNLGGSDARIVNLTQKHIRGRLAEALIVLRENYGYEDDNATIKIYMSREDIANLSNMTTSNAIRTLSNFSSEGIVSLEGRSIRIIDEEKLKRISRIG